VIKPRNTEKVMGWMESELPEDGGEVKGREVPRGRVFLTG
jgi:hypothetical protein